MTLCPTYTFIDRSNGLFNENMSFKREYPALISAAWEIDHAYDQYLTYPDAYPDGDNPLYRLGLINQKDDDEESREKREMMIRKVMQLPKDNHLRKRVFGDASNEEIEFFSALSDMGKK